MNLRVRSVLWTAVILASVTINLEFFGQLLAYSPDFSSLIYMMPILSAVLIFGDRRRIFADAHTSGVEGAVIAGAGFVLFLCCTADLVPARALAIVLIWIGAFVLFYGRTSGRRALFPLFMLVFMIPIPEAWLAGIIHALQKGSAEGVAILYNFTGTPYHRDGLSFLLPKISIDIAPQCSSIRSSQALLITCLIAGHLALKTTSRKIVFALLAVPMAAVKNSIRIATLSLLAIHVDTQYLVGGELHQRGGIVFFLVALGIMGPVLWGLRRGERRATNYTDYTNCPK